VKGQQWGSVLGREQQAPSQSTRDGDLGSAVSSLSGFWGGALTDKQLSYILSPPVGLSDSRPLGSPSPFIPGLCILLGQAQFHQLFLCPVSSATIITQNFMLKKLQYIQTILICIC